MSELVITKENFEKEVVCSQLPVMIDFWASWCGPCKMLAPVVAELAEELDGKAKVGKVNVDEQPELAATFQISSIPTVVVMKNGKMTQSSVGVRPKQQLLEMLSLSDVN